MRWLVALILCAGPAWGGGDDLVAQIDRCVGPLGQPAEHAELCMGVHAEPCMQIAENQSTQGMVACISAETAAWDWILNREYRGLRMALDEEQKDALRDAQRKWIAFRDADCAFPHIFVRGTLSQPWGADCVMQHTARRAMELRGFRNYLEY